MSAEVEWAGTGRGVLVPLSWLSGTLGTLLGWRWPSCHTCQAAVWVWLVAGCQERWDCHENLAAWDVWWQLMARGSELLPCSEWILATLMCPEWSLSCLRGMTSITQLKCRGGMGQNKLIGVNPWHPTAPLSSTPDQGPVPSPGPACGGGSPPLAPAWC